MGPAGYTHTPASRAGRVWVLAALFVAAADARWISVPSFAEGSRRGAASPGPQARAVLGTKGLAPRGATNAAVAGLAPGRAAVQPAFSATSAMNGEDDVVDVNGFFACSPNSSLTPSWCAYQNPFIVAQPPTKLAAPQPLAEYERRFACDDADGADPFGRCDLIARFTPVEAQTANDTMTKFIIVTSRGSSDPDADFSLQIFDARFNLLATPMNASTDSGFPGPITVLETMASQVDGGATNMIVYGGNVGANERFNESIHCSDAGGPYGLCALVSFTEWNTVTHGDDLSNLTAAFPTEGGYLLQGYTIAEGVFLRDSRGNGPGSNLSLVGGDVTFAALLFENSTVSGSGRPSGWRILFFALRPGVPPTCYLSPTCFQPIALWSIVRNGQELPPSPPLQLATVTLHSNCTVGPVLSSLCDAPSPTNLSDSSVDEATVHSGVPNTPTAACFRAAESLFAYGGFFNEANCLATVALAISDAMRVGVFAVNYANATVDLGGDAAATFFDLDLAPVPPSNPGALVTNRVITDLQIIPQVPADLRTALDDAPATNFSANATNLPRLPAPSQALWLVVAIAWTESVPATNVSSTLSRLLVAPVPEFAPPNANSSQQLPPTLANPAGQPAVALAAQCGPMAFFDFASQRCVSRPVQIAWDAAQDSAASPSSSSSSSSSFSSSTSSSSSSSSPSPAAVALTITEAVVRYRDLEPTTKAFLQSTGCMLSDFECVVAFINATGIVDDLQPSNVPGGIIPTTATAHDSALRDSTRPTSPHVRRARALLQQALLLQHTHQPFGANEHRIAQLLRASTGTTTALGDPFLHSPTRSLGASVSPAPNGSIPWLPVTLTADEVARELYAGLYGLRYQVFLSTTGRALPIAQVMWYPPLEPPNATDTANWTTLAQSVNSLALLGNAISVEPTANGQYVFIAVDRASWELHTMERLVEVCAALEVDPTDPFLAAWQTACAGDALTGVPRLPAVSDFIQVASACFQGTYCSSFTFELVSTLPDGYYSAFCFDDSQCEPGNFCKGGRRQPCPTGFECPNPGMALPQQCSPDPSLESTCFGDGTILPVPAPPGTLGGIPYVPPLPAPPGFAQTWTNTADRTLVACTPGDWCGLGRSVPSPAGVDPNGTVANSTLACPADTFCSDPAVVEPSVCDMNGTCVVGNCSTGHVPYCPEGSTVQVPCPAGGYCSDPHTLHTCSLGSYCPPGSALWQTCPPQYYCPTTSERIQCPDGYFCPEGVIAPVKCGLSSKCSCPGGCSEPTNWTSVPAVVGIVVALVLLFFLTTFLLRLRRERRDQRMEQLRNSPLAIDFASLDDLGVEVTGRSAGSATAPSGASSAAATTSSTSSAAAGSAVSASTGLYRPLLEGDEADASRGHRASSTTSLASSLARKEFTVEIGFRDLGLVLKGTDKAVMRGVTGRLRPGRVCAVMGPSGAGKSTFLTTLAGKATYGTMTGSIFLNGQESPSGLAGIAHAVGFVPQEDIMMRTLTVEENLRYSAFSRLPREWTEDRKLAFVESVIGALGLREIRHSIIGDESQRGISGGQRKRVNIAIEMVADPTVLFLDEPTSGLDATSSMEVCKALRSIARIGLTVVTVIHQPRYEIFTSFDDVLLLGKGGRTVYLGPSQEAVAYFEAPPLGIQCPARVNPADFLMDVIAGDVSDAWKSEHPDFKPEHLFDLWVQSPFAAATTVPTAGKHSSASSSSVNSPREKPPQTRGDARWGARRGGGAATEDTGDEDGGDRRRDSNDDDDDDDDSNDGSDRRLVVRMIEFDAPAYTPLPPPRASAGFLFLVWLAFKRSLTQQMRQVKLFVIDNALVFISAVFLAAVYMGEPWFSPPQPKEVFEGCNAEIGESCQLCLSVVKDQILNRGIMTCIALGLTGAASMIRVFGSERIVYWREASALPQPRHSVAYFFGKDLSMLLQSLMGTLFYTIMFVTLTGPRAPFSKYYALFLGVYYTSGAVGYLVSIAVPPAMAQLAGVVFVFGSSMFAGADPVLKDLYTKIPPLCWLPYVSYLRYALEGLYLIEVVEYREIVALSGVDLGQHISDTYGFQLDAFPRDCLVVFAFGFFFRIVAAAIMVVLDRDKKK